MKQTLWTKNFSLLILATALGSIGGIAGTFALSFLVFDETGSTFAAAVIIAIEVIPYIFIPALASPIMDRLPRKPFLVFGDLINGILFTLAGIYMLNFEFSYVGYLCFSLLLSCLSSFDQLAYDSIYPNLIPKGFEQKGYAVSSMLYPILKVIITPIAAILYDKIGVAWILIAQGAFCALASFSESFIRMDEKNRMEGQKYSIGRWWQDIKEAALYLRNEKGLQRIYSYVAISNGVAGGSYPLIIAFFRTTPGLSPALYSFFSVAEFVGRSIGSAMQYKIKIPSKKKFPFVYFVYQFYDLMDTILLWLPYPLMLANRAACGLLGSNSATMRQAAVQSYIPDEFRSRINAFEIMLITVASSIFSLICGALGEILDYKMAVTVCASIPLLCSWLIVWSGRRHVRKVYEHGGEKNKE
ncbi:MAG: MFS transporter [Ruminococcaceae bacterium]|nr:MFS transporter [Oscillospiraceae bacterium]